MDQILTKKQGYKQSKLGLIPEDWKVVKLGDLGSFYKGKGVSKSEIVEEGKKAVRYGELYTVYHIRTNSVKSKISDESAKNSRFGLQGDILFPGSGESADEIGKPCLLDEDAYLSGDLIAFRPNNLHSLFLAYTLNMPYGFKFREARGQGNSVVHIYSKDLNAHPVILPPLPEQQKIAAILSTWDESLSELDALIAAKKQLKKGLMQQLLTGQKRFPEFANSQHHRLNRLYEGTDSINNNSQKSEKSAQSEKSVVKTMNGYKQTKLGLIPEDWEVVNIETVGKVLSGGTPDTLRDEYWNGLINWITPTDITALRGKKEIGKTKRRISEIGLKESSAKLLPIGAIVVCTRATIGELAILNEEATTNQGFKNLITNEKAKNEFVFYVLKSIKNQMLQKSSGSTFLELSTSDFRKLLIPLPPLPEQQKIATTLSAIDNEIQELENQKTAYQIQKKGLMQVLLTGKVRVEVN